MVFGQVDHVTRQVLVDIKRLPRSFRQRISIEEVYELEQECYFEFGISEALDRPFFLALLFSDEMGRFSLTLYNGPMKPHYLVTWMVN